VNNFLDPGVPTWVPFKILAIVPKQRTSSLAIPLLLIMGICSGTSTEWLFEHSNLDRNRIWKWTFLRRGENQSSRGKTGVPREKPLSAEKRTNNKLNPNIASSPRIDPSHTGERQVLSTLRHPCSPSLWRRAIRLEASASLALPWVKIWPFHCLIPYFNDWRPHWHGTRVYPTTTVL